MASVEGGGVVAQIGAASLSQTRERNLGQAAHQREESAWSSLYVLRRAPLIYAALMMAGFAIGFSCVSVPSLTGVRSTAVLMRPASYPDGRRWIAYVVRGIWAAAAIVLISVALTVWRWASALATQVIE